MIPRSSTNINFASAHRLAGNYLSYDTQTKGGFDSVPVPVNGFDPSPTPTYYGAGISFRLDDSLNFYGVSFMRGNNGVPSDEIDNALLPEDDINLIVLWQQTGNGTNRKWLAYSEVGLLFSDDVEDGVSGWTAGGSWGQTTNDFHSPNHSWTDSPGSQYANNENASLTSDPIDLSGLSSGILSFWHKYDFRVGDADFGFLEISANAGPWNQLAQFSNDQFTWQKYEVDISGYLTTNVRIRFRIQTDGINQDDGWWVDDITIITDFIENFDTDKATLLLRLIEGATLQFDSGGTTAIEKGDIVSQSNGARGIVIIPPIMQSGSWAGGDASGILILNKVSSTSFQTGNPLNVPGKGNNLATVQGFKARDNYIQAYYGNKDGNGTPDGNPYDQQRQPNDIGIANWPVDPGEPLTPANDYYTLVQWNWDVDASVSRLPDGDGKYTLIATDTLTSPTGIFPYSRPELGLHAMGDGAENVFYDDFAIQLDVQSGSGFLTPIQQ
jgi:hypothetical protein